MGPIDKIVQEERRKRSSPNEEEGDKEKKQKKEKEKKEKNKKKKKNNICNSIYIYMIYKQGLYSAAIIISSCFPP